MRSSVHILDVFATKLCQGTRASASLLLLAFVTISCGSSLELDSARRKVADAERELAAFETARQDNALEQAQLHFDNYRRDLAEARDHYLRAGAGSGRDVSVLTEFGQLAEQTEDYDLAASAFERAASIEPERAEFWLSAGTNYRRVGESMSEEALDTLREALRLAELGQDQHLTARVYEQMGHVYLGLELYSIARSHYEEAIALSGDSLLAKLAIASLDFRDGDILSAASAIDRAGALGPAEVAFLDKALREAYTGLRRNRTHFPDTAEHQFAYARILVRLSVLTETLMAARRSVEIDDSNYVTWNFLGSLAQQMGDQELAKGSFERSLQLEPDQPRTREALDIL